jgi:hypothetical protein
MLPPSLNIVELSPVTPTPVMANESATGEKSHDNELAQALRQTAAGPEESSSTTQKIPTLPIPSLVSPASILTLLICWPMPVFLRMCNFSQLNWL